MSATKPDTAAALHARPGRGTESNRADVVRTFRSALRGRFSCAGPKACTTAAFSACAFRASHSAPAAARTFSATPTNVVPRTPIAGISQKPAAIAPAAAPAVLAEYSAPTSADTVRLKADSTVGNLDFTVADVASGFSRT